MTHVVRRAGLEDAAVAGRLLYDFNREFDEPTPAPSALARRIRQLLEGGDTLSPEFEAIGKQVGNVGMLAGLTVVVTIFFMTYKPFM